MTFEEWRSQSPLLQNPDIPPSIKLLWAWDAATLVERERAAALIEDNYGWRNDNRLYCDNLADAIRSSGETQ